MVNNVQVIIPMRELVLRQEVMALKCHSNLFAASGNMHTR